MANDEHLKMINEGVEVWNRWRKSHLGQKPDLSNANLRGARLSGVGLIWANLSGADLRSTDLRGANLSETDLRNADLRESDLSGAHLDRANLSDADISKAHLKGADLSGVQLMRTRLDNADLNNCGFGWAIINNVDLSEAIGLETIRHYGPSSVGIDTIYKSHGEIPEVFLRSAGVPENFIKYMHSLIGKAIQYYSCFISYSTKDQEFAERLHADLQSKGVRCWFAPEDIKGGRKLHEQIPEAIKLYDKLLLVLSPNIMSSEWVKTEIYHARQDEIRNSKRKLFPIGLVEFNTIREWEAFDADSGKDMGREIREYFIPDFSNWKNHDAYKKAFDRLLHDLQAD